MNIAEDGCPFAYRLFGHIAVFQIEDDCFALNISHHDIANADILDNTAPAA